MLYRKQFYPIVLMLLFISVSRVSQAQGPAYHRCGTMEALELAFKKQPSLRQQFEKSAQRLTLAITQPVISPSRAMAVINIPIVFHIVLTNPSVVTDAQIQAQLDRLNTDFQGLNADSTKIPAVFKPRFGKTSYHFLIAKQTPDGEPTTGIERFTTTHNSFAIGDSTLKHLSAGGADAWDPSRYLNVWIANISGGILGYTTFPNTGPANEQGVAIHYASMPGGSLQGYNLGRTLTHETGHYFFLYHIWGDDNGACTGSDLVDDTPNQGNSTSGCPTGIKTDNCSPDPPGILYEDYMDYTDDPCMVMFTVGQVQRMQTAFDTYRSSLLNSNGAQAPVLRNLDAALKAINQPAGRQCTPSVVPAVVIRNKGSQTITTFTVTATVDDNKGQTINWTGSLSSLTDVAVQLPVLNLPQGAHSFTAYVSNPNGAAADDNTLNDTLRGSFTWFAPVEPPLYESFEGGSFPPPGWDIVNPDHSYTWEKVTGVAKTGNASVVMRNFEYATNNAKDYLRLPLLNISNADSAFMTFQVAAAVQTDPQTKNNVWDTLQVLVSTDCGATYTSLYKKWDTTLITHNGPVPKAFVPAANEWRKDSVNLTPYINAGPITVAFLNTSEYENDIYLDDVNVYKVVINPNLKAKGFLVNPNPTTGIVAVQFYPNPANLRAISIFDANGRKIIERQTGNERGLPYYSFDLSHFADGVYFLHMVFSDKTVNRKILKLR